jgi:hypothetical protein
VSRATLIQHGDIRMRLALRGEPQKLLVYWRGSLSDILPTSASVSIIRPLRRSYLGYWNPSLYFEAISRSEKKRADLSISETSLEMEPEEIQAARHLTDLLFKWLSKRQFGVPTLDQPIMKAAISLVAEGDHSLLNVIKSFGDPEVIASVSLGPVYLQGEPRRPGIRWLPPLEGIDSHITIGVLGDFEKSLAAGQAEKIRSLVDLVVAIFRKRLAARRSALNKKYTELWGAGSQLRINDRPVTDRMIERRFAELQLRLEDEAKPKHHRTRAWRSPDQ